MKIIALTQRLSVTLIIALNLSACNNNSPVLECDDSSVVQQLLQLSKDEASGVQFINESITEIRTKRRLAQSMECQVKVNYSHEIFPERNIEEDYNFSINPQAQVNGFTLADQRNAKNHTQWLAKLPTVVALQKSRFGNLTVLQIPQDIASHTKNQVQQIAFNQELLALPNGKNYSTITIDKKFTLATSDIFVITAYYNNPSDIKQNHNYFIAIESSARVTISPVFSYRDGSMHQNASAIVFAGLNHLPFAESSDYPIYSFNSQGLNILQESKPLSYYHKKFAELNASKILQQIKSDGCLNGDQFYLSEICATNIYSYCFKFHSTVRQPKNKDYWLLQNMCKTQQY